MTDREHIWKALADPTRRALLDLLRDGPHTTSQLCESFPTSRFAVMKHLGVLLEANLVTVERRGRERWNHLNAVPVTAELERWLTPYSRQVADAVIALERAVTAANPKGDPMSDAAMHRGEIDVASEIEVDASREKVFEALLDVGQWWPHRFRENVPVVLEPHVGGRWYEDWGNGEGALYGTVGALQRPSRISFTGPLGMDGPVASVWAMELEERGDRTVVRGRHRAFGDISADTTADYTQGWTGVYAALRGHLGVA